MEAGEVGRAVFELHATHDLVMYGFVAGDCEKCSLERVSAMWSVDPLRYSTWNVYL